MIGITDKTRRIEGVDFETKKLNELLRVPLDFCNPTIKDGIEKVPCIDDIDMEFVKEYIDKINYGKTSRNGSC